MGRPDKIYCVSLERRKRGRMTTILSLNDWFEVVRRGTSGDQVIDILYSWKEQSEKKDAEIDQLRSENERLIAKIKELANYELEIFEHRHLSQCAYDIRDIAREALNEVTE